MPPTTSTPRLAIAYDITASSPMSLGSQLADLADLLWIADLSDPRLGSMRRLLPRLGGVVDTQGRTTEEIAALVGTEGVHGVVAYCDDQLHLAAEIAALLGLAGNPVEVVGRLNDKHAQRAALAAAGLPMPGFRRVPAGADATTALRLAAELDFPVVFKPLHGDSSKHVVAVDDPTALRAALDAGPAVDGSLTEDCIVEEYLADRPSTTTPGIAGYISVEMVATDGVPVAAAITGKFPLAPPFRETGNFMPHPLTAPEADDVLAVATQAAEALGVRCGVLHVEIKLTPDGPRIIEVNGRVAGGAIDLIYARRNPRSLTQLAALSAMGLPLDLSAESPAEWDGPFDYEFFVQPPVTATRLVSTGGPEAVIGVAGAQTVAANRSPGDDLDWRRGSQEYVLRVTGIAADREALSAVPEALTGAASIVYATAPD